MSLSALVYARYLSGYSSSEISLALAIPRGRVLFLIQVESVGLQGVKYYGQDGEHYLSDSYVSSLPRPSVWRVGND